MQFSCNGTITALSIAMLNNRTADQYPEVQLWRESKQSLYTNVGGISLAAAKRTSNLNIYKLDLEEPITFEEEDVIGLYLPRRERSKFAVQFRPTVSEDVGASVALSYRQTTRTAVIDLTNAQLLRDSDIPMMLIESGEQGLANCDCIIWCDWQNVHGCFHQHCCVLAMAAIIIKSLQAYAISKY